MSLLLPLLLLLSGHVAAQSVVINEIMYHHPANEMFEFVELHNRDAAVAANVAGWRLMIGNCACACAFFVPPVFLTRSPFVCPFSVPIATQKFFFFFFFFFLCLGNAQTT